MAKNMYQKREKRKNKKLNEETRSLTSTSINWMSHVFAKYCLNHYR